MGLAVESGFCRVVASAFRQLSHWSQFTVNLWRFTILLRDTGTGMRDCF